ncbi:MAG TPA: CAAX prenyl protease-related protein [Verrucomicrobiae bacterium]|nr:CAAX prenyl protease-related protein [Verrucomicrobiae bacterium]
MRLLKKFFAGSPAAARVAPFLVFLALTACQGKFGAASAYWFYLAKTIVGAWLVWEMRPFVSEMRWAISLEAVVVGIGIFAVWIGLDQYYPHLMKGGATGNPNDQFGEGSALAWFFIVVHILGMTLVVPPLEEVFYRSFLYRCLANQNFLSVPLNRFLPFPFFATTIIFGFSHNEWLAGILCGAAFQWLAIRKNRLGEAMTAHAITNFLLGAWIVWRGAWHFW